MYVNKKSDCPRGFIREKGKCLPSGVEVNDKLVLKYERYFFKEGEIMKGVTEWTSAGTEINNLYRYWENDVERADRACGKQFGGFKALKKENRKKYAQCRKAGHIQAAKSYIQKLLEFQSKCKSGDWDTQACLERLQREVIHAKKKLQKATTMREGKEMENCKTGFRWCPIQKKCVPEDDVRGQGRRQGRGQGKGPIGQPMKVKEAFKLVDIAYDEGFEIFGKATKAEKQVKRILDTIEEDWKGAVGGMAKGIGTGIAVSGAMAGAGALAKRMSGKGVCSDKFQKGTPGYRRCMHKMVHGEGEEIVTINSSSGRPYDHPKKTRLSVDVDECDDGGMNGGMMGGGRMKKGISGGDADIDSDDYGFDGERDQQPERPDNPRKHSNDINQVPNQKVKALYQSIRNQMAESDLVAEADDYKAYFDGMLKKFGVNSPKDLDNDKKKAFFNAVDKGWKGKDESD